MTDIDWPDGRTLVAGEADWVGPDLAAALARHPLDCVDTEYPHHATAVEGPDDHVPPAEQHPVFYGCYDWHSAVHSHWSLVRGLRLFEDHPDADAIVAGIDDRFTDEGVAAEVDYLAANPTFERPYGWAWLLRLGAELALWDDARADRWRATLRPLEDQVLELVREQFLDRDRPIRVGTHGNSAFALAAVHDYARVTDDADLASAAAGTARRWFHDDENYGMAYEPLGWDFISPGLAEADLLRRVLDGPAFDDWLGRFLPGVVEPPHADLPDPVTVDGDDGMALHLVGLNLSRAWCLAGVADALDDGSRAAAFRRCAATHAEAGMERAFTDDYAGAHWLTSFVLYLVTREEGAIAPG